MDLTFDPTATAIVVIDLQKGIVGRSFEPHSSDLVVGNTALLSDALRRAGGRPIYVNVKSGEFQRPVVDMPFAVAGTPPPDSSEIATGAGMQARDILVTKRSWGAFYGTDLDLQLRRRAIRTLILAGIATNFGVESTARAAFDRGYELIFAADAMSSMCAAGHEFAVANIFPRMGRVRTTKEIIESLS